jgi:hypothetical protein
MVSWARETSESMVRTHPNINLLIQHLPSLDVEQLRCPVWHRAVLARNVLFEQSLLSGLYVDNPQEHHDSGRWVAGADGLWINYKVGFASISQY